VPEGVRDHGPQDVECVSGVPDGGLQHRSQLCTAELGDIGQLVECLRLAQQVPRLRDIAAMPVRRGRVDQPAAPLLVRHAQFRRPYKGRSACRLPAAPNCVRRRFFQFARRRFVAAVGDLPEVPGIAVELGVVALQCRG
jgi:hypothetical protein